MYKIKRRFHFCIVIIEILKKKGEVMFKNIGRIKFAVLLITLPLITALVCIGVGRYYLSAIESLQILFRGLVLGQEHVSNQSYSVVINMRLPRILLALLCGAGLAVAGSGLQALFSNPLVSPDTLGVASGASFGAALALLFNGNMVAVQLSALIFGIIAVFLTYNVGKIKGKTTIIMLVLSGMMISSLFQALVSLIKYVADTENQLPAITYWLMGSLGSATFRSVAIGSVPIIVGCIILFGLRWKMNILSLTEDEARTLGVNVKKMRAVVIFASTMITASCVSMCGQIGWIGLLIPHMCRMMFGSNNKSVIPASISFGAVFMLIIDTIARSATTSEIPISILTSVIGAPCFIVLLRRTGGSNS